jgi:hypothetical protein
MLFFVSGNGPGSAQEKKKKKKRERESIVIISSVLEEMKIAQTARLIQLVDIVLRSNSAKR